MTPARVIIASLGGVLILLVAVLVATRGSRGEIASTPSRTVTSAVPRGGVRVLIATGDIACAPGAPVTTTRCHQAATAALLDPRGPIAATPTAVLLLGDTQYEAARVDEYASFAATWGAALAASPATAILPVPGNHEWYDPDPPPGDCRLQDAGHNACGYESYFGAAAWGAPTGDGRGNYVRVFDRSDRHPLVVVMLDAGRCEQDRAACAVGSPTQLFLQTTLSDATVNLPAACTIVGWHQARWSDAGHGNLGMVDALWTTLFEVPPAQRPDLVVNGHDHLYARMRAVGSAGQPSPDGIPEIIAGAGGREIAGVPYAGPALLRAAFMDLQHFGVLRIEYDPAAGDLSTSFVIESGDIEDDARVACRV
jgi:hypothetical protein